MAARPRPMVTLTCHYGHTVAGYGVAPGNSTRCRHVLGPGDARRDGTGELHCPRPGCPDLAARAKSAPPAADGERCGVNILYRPGGGAGDARTAVWRDLAPWDGQIRISSLPPAAEPCPKCGGPCVLTPRATGLCCPACKHVWPPARVRSVASVRAERSARSAQVADPAAELAASLDLAAQADQCARLYRRWAEAMDPDEPEDLRDYSFYGDAADLRDRFRRLAEHAARNVKTAADLAAMRKVAADAIDRAAAIQHGIYSARAEVAEMAEPAEYADAELVEDDYTSLPASDPLAAVREQWAGKIEDAARELPGRAGLTAPYAAVASARLATLDAALAAIDSARTTADLAAAIRQAEDAIDSAGKAARSLPTGSAPRALPSPTATAGADLAAMLAEQRRQRAARVARYGRCQSNHHTALRVLGADLPPAEYRYQGGTVDYNGGGHATYGAPFRNVCASAKCRAWAESWLRAQGYPDNRQVYERLTV